MLYPRLASAEAVGDRPRADLLVRRAVLRLCLPLALLSLVSLPAVSPVIGLVAGREYGPAAAPTAVLVVGVALSLLTLPVRSLFLVRNQVTAMFWFTTAVSIVCLVAYWPLGAAAGATGIAWARTGTVLIGTAAMVGYLRRTGRNRSQPPSPPTQAASTALTGEPK